MLLRLECCLLSYSLWFSVLFWVLFIPLNLVNKLLFTHCLLSASRILSPIKFKFHHLCGQTSWFMNYRAPFRINILSECNDQWPIGISIQPTYSTTHLAYFQWFFDEKSQNTASDHSPVDWGRLNWLHIDCNIAIGIWSLARKIGMKNQSSYLGVYHYPVWFLIPTLYSFPQVFSLCFDNSQLQSKGTASRKHRIHSRTVNFNFWFYSLIIIK
jgi:hypothetical protein